eukprot:15471-Eustigmatos_ZCMA.PRE.1
MASATTSPSGATFPSIQDPSSAANFSEVVNTHFDLQLEVSQREERSTECRMRVLCLSMLSCLYL